MMMRDLREIWTIKGWLADRNSDEVPDGVKARFVLGRDNPSGVKRGWIELAGRLGLETTGFSFPLMQWDDAADLFQPSSVFIGVDHKGFSNRVIVDWDKYLAKRNALQEGQGLIAIVKLQSGENAIIVTGKGQEGVYFACLHLATYIEEDLTNENGTLASEWIVDATEARNNGTLQTVNGHCSLALPERIGLDSLFTEQGLFQRNEHDLSNVLQLRFLSEDWQDDEITAAADLAARIGLEATGLQFPITRETAEWRPGEAFSILLKGTDWSPSIHLEQQDRQLRLVIQGTDINNTVRWMTNELFGTNDQPLDRTWRQAAFLLRTPSHPMRQRLLHEMALERSLQDLRDAKAEIELAESMANPIDLWQKTIDRAGADAEIRVIRQEPAFSMRWEEAGEFVRIAELFQQSLQAIASGDKVRVEAGVTLSPASREKLALELRKMGSERGIEVETHIRSAWKQGYSWIEQEVLPELKQAGDVGSLVIRFRPFVAPEGKSCKELPIRWLQELYPIDEVIGSELGINAEHVTFIMDDTQPSTYVLVAKNKKGKEIKTYEFQARTRECLFLAGMEEEGFVYPPAGWMRMTVGNSIIFDQNVATDLERFWDWYQNTFLSQLKAWLEQTGRQQAPLFGKLDCHVRMDTEERLLNIREETFSILEALHEDIYFNTLDYVTALGKRKGLDWEASGQILPWMESVFGIAPNAQILFYDLPPSLQQVRLNDLTIDPIHCLDQRIVGVSWEGEEIRFVIEGENPGASDVESWLRNLYKSERSPQAETQLPQTAIPLDIVIDDQRLKSLYGAMSQLGGVRVIPMEISYQGREISVVELTLPVDVEVVSKMKLSLWKPTIFINARHHANEVSSTNAALKLIEDLAKEKNALLKRCNVIVSPMANPDGVAAHYAMFMVNPQWKLHAARYNAAGFEFAKHRFREDTPYGESRIYEKVWRRWAPDIVIDDHGVPSHEWVQPFSGYNSPPRFPVSYWLPHALIYTIALALDDSMFPQHAGIREAILRILAGRMKEKDGIRNGNEYWLGRYQKWGNQWLPEPFPLEIENGLITYRRKGNSDSQSKNLGERYAHLVSFDIITEVADETADGMYLSECVQAHYEMDLAVVEWLSGNRQQVHRERVDTDSGTMVRLFRPRPLQV
jgi:hypothetical protein